MEVIQPLIGIAFLALLAVYLIVEPVRILWGVAIRRRRTQVYVRLLFLGASAFLWAGTAGTYQAVRSRTGEIPLIVMMVAGFVLFLTCLVWLVSNGSR